MGNQNWVWPSLEKEMRESCQMHTLVRGLGLPENTGSGPSGQTIPRDFFNLQLVVGGWPEMVENKNTNAVPTLFSESH